MSFAGELVEFPHRNPVLPKIYRWHGRHVKSPKFGNHTRTTYLALLDNSPEGLKALIEYIEKASIPTSTDDDELFTAVFITIGPSGTYYAGGRALDLGDASDLYASVF